MIRRQLCILVFSLGLTFFLHGQSLSQTYALAQTLQALGQYEQALTAYQRIVFFDEQQTLQADCYRQMGLCAEALGQYKNADRYLNFAYYLTTDPDEQQQIQFQQIRLRLLQGDFIAAQEELWVLGTLSSSERPLYHLYSFVASFGQGRYDSARQHIAFFVSGNDSLSREVELLFTQNDKVSRISARKARIMSMILPGLGQFYAGRPGPALNSMALTGGLLVLSLRIAALVSPLDAALAVIPWFVRYYQGGYERAGVMALQKQERRRAEIYQDLLTLIEAASEGP